MYEVLMYDGGVYRVNELYELVEDVGGFIIQKTQIQVQILLTMASNLQSRPAYRSADKAYSREPLVSTPSLRPPLLSRARHSLAPLTAVVRETCSSSVRFMILLRALWTSLISSPRPWVER